MIRHFFSILVNCTKNKIAERVYAVKNDAWHLLHQFIPKLTPGKVFLFEALSAQTHEPITAIHYRVREFELTAFRYENIAIAVI